MKFKKRVFWIIIILSMVITVHSNAATVLWNYVEVYTFDRGTEKHISVSQYNTALGPYTSFGFWVNNGKIGTSAVTEDTPILMTIYYNLCLATLGDVVDSSSIAASALPLGSSELHPKYQYSIEAGNNFYVMFETSLYDERESPYYGWAEFYLSEDGDLSLVTIAADWSHNSIVVGATPEPVSWLLLLLGSGMVGLRRKS